jgi:ASF1 like histone chaperone
MNGACALLQANNPDPAQLPQGEVLGITAILLTCSYNTKVRLGAWPSSSVLSFKPQPCLWDTNAGSLHLAHFHFTQYRMTCGLLWHRSLCG